MAATAAPTTTTALPLRAAAARLGLSTDTLRKRLQRGLTPGRKVDGSWLVDVPAVPDHPQDGPGPVPDMVPDGPGHPGPVRDGSASVQDQAAPQGAQGAALAVQRAAEMAAYSQQLLAPYVAKIETQAERIGRLENELDHLRAQLAAATPAPEPDGQAAPPDAQNGVVRAGHESGRSRWWQRLGAWLSGAPAQPAANG